MFAFDMLIGRAEVTWYRALTPRLCVCSKCSESGSTRAPVGNMRPRCSTKLRKHRDSIYVQIRRPDNNNEYEPTGVFNRFSLSSHHSQHSDVFGDHLICQTVLLSAENVLGAVRSRSLGARASTVVFIGYRRWKEGRHLPDHHRRTVELVTFQVDVIRDNTTARLIRRRTES